jgi:hypothetical protein
MSCLQNDIIIERLWEEHEELYRELMCMGTNEELSSFDIEFLTKTVENAFDRMGG